MSVEFRLGRLRKVMNDLQVDAILVTKPANRRYLTGFTAPDHAADESAGVVIITEDSATLLVSPTNLSWARSESNNAAISVEPYTASWVDAIAQMVRSKGLTSLAIEDAPTPAACWFDLQDLLPNTSRMVRAEDAVDQLRAVKSDHELAMLREAARRTDAAFARAISQFSPGMTEFQAAELVRAALQEVGSEGEAFETIVASGLNAAKPHHRPGSRVMQSGEPIIVDMGARIDGYNGDLTRTVCFGAPDDKLVRIYEAVLCAQAEGLAAIQPHDRASLPDLATRKVFQSQGLEQFVIHGVGHGLGLQVHEAPSIRKSSEAILIPGNVVTMEPGLYLPDWGGVRIEDVAIVTDHGHENITGAPKGVDKISI